MPACISESWPEVLRYPESADSNGSSEMKYIYRYLDRLLDRHFGLDVWEGWEGWQHASL